MVTSCRRDGGRHRLNATPNRTWFGLVATVTIAVSLAWSASAAWAQPNPFWRANKRCIADAQCGSATRCQFGICRPQLCGIDGALITRGERNPSNPCEACNPNRNYRRWSAVKDGTVCGNPTGEECISAFNTCMAGNCVLTPRPDGADCGNGQVCCGGGCCGAGEACGAGGCEPTDDDDDDDCLPPTCPIDPPPCDGPDCPRTCSIDGVVYGAGDTDPTRQCWGCDPDLNRSDWSPKPDNSVCGTTTGRLCCNGECCGPDQCCAGVLCTFDSRACFPQ